MRFSRALQLRGSAPARWLAAALLVAAGVLPAAPAGATTRYLAFGDSVTEGIGFDRDCPCRCTELCGYPRRLENRLQNAGVDAVVKNHGLSGEDTIAGLTRLDDLLTVESFDIMILMEGTNDVSRAIPPETTIFNLDQMARRAAQDGMSTIHATLIPRFPEAKVDPENVLNEALVRDIRELAFETGRRLADPYQVFTSAPDVFERFYADNFPNDPVGHPNPAGFTLLADIFFRVLTNQDLVSPVVGSVSPPDGSLEVFSLTPVEVRLYDFGTGLRADATRLFVNGVDVPLEITAGAKWLDAVYRPEAPWEGTVTVDVYAEDRAAPANVLDRHLTTFTSDGEDPGLCVPDEITLCIDDEPGDGRFRVRMSWSTALNGGQGGDALATPLAGVGLDKGGLFSFFAGNPEALVKVLDGCGTNDHFWVFGSAATTLGFELVVEDTLAIARGVPLEESQYRIVNVDGDFAQPFFDTLAFDTCDVL